MHTCPHCHNVLVSPLCCANANQQVPMVFSFANPPLPHLSGFHSTTASASQEPNSPFTNTYMESSNEDSECQRQLSSLPTPHVSGHMFQFPLVNDVLTSHINTCQLTCHINCLTHGTFQYGASPWRDSLPCNSRRRQSGEWMVRTPTVSSVSEDEINRRVEASKSALKKSGWYWARLSWQEAEVILQPSSVGTFLVRDSADPHHRFSLSVQTEKGPTSVRIQLSRGKFRLRCDSSVKASLPEFSCVIKLIEHYISANEKQHNHVWVDASGKIYSPIRIHRPLRKEISSLMHLCRLAVNFSFPRSVTSQRLPPSLAKYLDEYPYWC